MRDDSIDVDARDAIDLDVIGYSYQQIHDPMEVLTVAGLARLADDQQPLLTAVRGQGSGRRDTSQLSRPSFELAMLQERFAVGRG